MKKILPILVALLVLPSFAAASPINCGSNSTTGIVAGFGKTLTFAYGTFSFTPTADCTDATSITVNLKQSGFWAGGYDHPIVSIYSDNAGAPGTLLISGGAPTGYNDTTSLQSTFTSFTFPLGGTLTLQAGVKYWFVFHRSGATDADTYYLLDAGTNSTTGGTATILRRSADLSTFFNGTGVPNFSLIGATIPPPPPPPPAGVNFLFPPSTAHASSSALVAAAASGVAGGFGGFEWIVSLVGIPVAVAFMLYLNGLVKGSVGGKYYETHGAGEVAELAPDQEKARRRYNVQRKGMTDL